MSNKPVVMQEGGGVGFFGIVLAILLALVIFSLCG